MSNPFGSMTLHWSGFASNETKCLLPDGRNLFKILPIESLAFDVTSGGKREALTLDVCLPGIDLVVHPMILSLDQITLRQIAEVHGYELVRKEEA